MKGRKKRFQWGYLLLAPALGFILFLEGSALFMMIAQSLGFLNYTGEDAFTFAHWQQLFSRNFFDNLMYSLKIALLASLLCLAVVYPLCLSIQKMPGKKTWLSLWKIPLFIPALIACSLMGNIIAYNGALNTVLLALKVIDKPLSLRNDAWGVGALLTQVWKNIPFMLLILYSAIEAVRKDVLDAGRNLGAGRVRLFFEVTLPVTMPSALVATIMTFIKVFNDYTISKVMGPIYPSTLSNLMHKAAYTLNDWHSAACIGCLMVVTSIIFVKLYTWLSDQITRRLS